MMTILFGVPVQAAGVPADHVNVVAVTAAQRSVQRTS